LPRAEFREYMARSREDMGRSREEKEKYNLPDAEGQADDNSFERPEGYEK